MNKSRPIQPLHPSMRNSLARGARLRPLGMTSFNTTAEQHEVLQHVALDIFTDMTNAGAPLQDALASIYFSGLMHGAQLLDRMNEEGLKNG